jgi:hypothetical protein
VIITVWSPRVTPAARTSRTRHPAGGAAHLGEGQPIEQAIAIMMDAHGRSAVHPDRIEGIGAFNEGREPTFKDSDF